MTRFEAEIAWDYRRVLDELPEGIAVVDGPSGRLLHANPSLLQLCGVGPLNAESNVRDLLAEYERWQAEARIEEALGGEVYEYERLLRSADQEAQLARIRLGPFPLAGPNAVLATVRNVSSERTASRVLRGLIGTMAYLDGPEFFESLVREFALAVGIKHVAVCRLAEDDQAETIAFWSKDHLAENFRYCLRGTPCESVLEGDTCIFPHDVKALFPEDEDLVALDAEAYIAVRLLDADGTTLGIFWAIHDEPLIEHRDTSEVLSAFAPLVGSQLRQLLARERADAMERQLQHSQKLESLGILAGGVAHDFNNLLTAILGNAELADMATDSSEVGEHLDLIRAGAQKAAGLCRQMLAYAGETRSHTEEVAVGDVLRETVKLVSAACPEGVQLKLEPCRSSRRVEADPTQLTQVVLNLVTNAVEAVDPGAGLVVVSCGEEECSSDDLTEMVLGEQAKPGPFAFLEITDNGPGLDPEVFKKMFDPFFSTKADGRGLGLSTVLGIIKAHAGAIRVFSDPAKGTTIRVLLPALLSEAEERAGSQIPGPLKGRCILLVEDDDAVRSTTAAFLAREGARVLTAENGAEAVTLFGQSERVDLVVLDYSMPLMNGEEAFYALRDQDPEAKVILMTGYDAERVSSRLTAMGLSGYLPKPFTRNELLDTVETVLTVNASVL